MFKAQCVACHGAPGIPTAPHLNDAAAWGPRIGQGYATLLEHALKGKGAMPPQGGGDFEDVEIGRAVVYMANSGGAKFPVPDRPLPRQRREGAASDAAAAAGGCSIGGRKQQKPPPLERKSRACGALFLWCCRLQCAGCLDQRWPAAGLMT